MNFSVFGTGLMMGLSLIVAIGAQNAFVLRQGLRNEHVFAVCLACGLSDAVLITLGVTSFRHVAALLPWLDPVMRYGGAAFLIWYGAKSLYSAFHSSGALTVQETASSTFRATLVTCLALTWLNPHVYLDTVVLLGTISRPGFRDTRCRSRREPQRARFFSSSRSATARPGCGRSSRSRRPGGFWKRSSLLQCG